MPKTASIVHVDVPVVVAYNQWTQFEMFPEFMYGVREVRQVDDSHLHWVMDAEGQHAELDTEIVEQRPNELISWRDAESGRVALLTFAPEGAGTRITLMVDTEPAPGVPQRIRRAMFGVAGEQGGADLELFKRFIESRRPEAGARRGGVPPEKSGEVVDV